MHSKKVLIDGCLFCFVVVVIFQWFGNLVTMNWWDDLWLNEGFASFAEYMGVSRIYPEWAMMDQFIHAKTLPALKTDALSTSHPVSVPVTDPMEIEAIFDTISYNKVTHTCKLNYFNLI